MATQEQKTRLSDVLDKLAVFKAADLVLSSGRGFPSLPTAQSDLIAVLSLVDDLKSLPLQHLPAPVIEQIIDSFEHMLPCYYKYKKFFVMNVRYPIQRKEHLLLEIRDCTNNIFTKTAVWIPFLAYKKGDIEENINRLSATIDQAERKSQQVEDIVSKVREAAANAGAGIFTEDFFKEAEHNRRNSFWWLAATVVFAFAAFGFSIWAYNDDYSKYKTPLSLWPKLTGKLILLSLYFTAAMWCGKIYKSAKHLSLLNRHRALGLKTFQAFSSAATDPHTKDVVLLETTRSIFTNSNTGLIAENGVGEIDSNIIQIAGKALEQTHGA